MQDYNEQDEKLVTFDDLKLSKEVLKAVHDLGFESPTPIQERSIPVVLEGRDMIGQAQTGTGKTAAFSLPILSKINTKKPYIQALILEPTRELAIQVSEACQSFAKYLKDFHVAPIYGGASYENQIRTLRHGSQVVVATPGRLIDLIERGKVDLSNLSYMVIDEADEMLRMGFIDDVDWILSNTPENRQTALFSATMPPVIAKIAKQHLTDPEDVRIESKTTTATTVHQRYWIASGAHKIDAMTRILEVEEYDAVIVFVRTKTDAEDVSTRLMGRGFACAALHGDIPQRQREKIIERLKKSQLDIIIATDVAARGLDVDRITHVFNYDIPYDVESYVHRIGRTGRAGRTGEAILFVSPRERRALRMIERVTGQRIEPMQMPSVADVNKARLMNFKNQVLETIEEGGLEMYEEVISELLSDDSIEVETLCAALAKMVQKDGTLLLDESKPEPAMRTFDDEDRSNRRGDSKGHGDRKSLPSSKAAPLRQFPDMNMVRFRVAVGHKDGVKPGQIVGAIANEGNIESKYIGEISIFDTFTTVDLPEGMPHETMEILYKARVCGRALELREYTAEPPRSRSRERSRDFDRQGPRSGRDFKNFEGERKDRRSKGGRPGLKFDRGSSRGNGRSFHTSGRREGF
ncbi:MAG: DEAD/DEAH box helicase [Succinivibrio sp.]